MHPELIVHVPKDRRQMADKDAEINPPSRRRVVNNIGVVAVLNRFSRVYLRDAGVPSDDGLISSARPLIDHRASRNLRRGNIARKG